MKTRALAGRRAASMVETPMNTALQKRCAAIQTWLARAASDDVQARHRVGQLLVDTRKKEQVYGANAMGHLAAALRRPVSTLYRYAFVAECWSGREMKTLAGQLNAFGEPLSWSHWVELAQVRSRNTRERLHARALKEGLSVRELAHAARTLEPSHVTDQDNEGDESIAEAVDEVARSCERWSCQALAAAQALASQLRTSERTSPQLLGQIGRAVRAHEAVRERSAEALRVLRAALGTLPVRVAIEPVRPPRRAAAEGGHRERPILMIAGMGP